MQWKNPVRHTCQPFNFFHKYLLLEHLQRCSYCHAVFKVQRTLTKFKIYLKYISVLYSKNIILCAWLLIISLFILYLSASKHKSFSFSISAIHYPICQVFLSYIQNNIHILTAFFTYKLFYLRKKDMLYTPNHTI